VLASRVALAQEGAQPPPLPPPETEPAPPTQPLPVPPPAEPEPPAAHPRRPHVPPGHPPVPLPPAPDESQFVTVTLEADKRGVWLEALVEREGLVYVRRRWWAYGRVGVWQHVCEAPCTMRVPPELRYRVHGPSVPASDAFFPGPPGGERRLHASAGSKGAQLGGALLVFLGIPTAIVGIVVTAESGGDSGRTAGFVTIGAGAALTAVGAVLIAANGTNVYDAAGRSVGSSPSPSASPLGFVF
jgi:hypothetical protein